MKDPSDDHLLALIGQGDREAFRRVLERHARIMLSLAERITGNPDDAAEVVQEAFLKVWTMASDWRVDGPAAFATWFHRVVFNASIDRRRRRPWIPLDEAPETVDPAPDGVTAAMLRQRRGAVLAAIGELPERQRDALLTHYFAESAGPEMAVRLGLSVGAVEALLVRARRALRKALIRRGITGIGDVS